MKYISKGMVEHGSTEHLLKVQRGGYTFQLTGNRAGLWINGRFGFTQSDDTPGTGGNWSICAASVGQNLPKRVRRENTVP